MKIGGSWKYSRSYNDARRGFAKGQWQERKMTPRFMLAPRVSAGGPRNRYEGKAVFSRLPLMKILWAVDSGRLNPNEVITLYQLRQARIIADWEVVWPGFVLLAGDVEKVPYPLNIELQNASAKTIKLIEEAGGSFTSVYMTHEGLYQEMNPEQFPTFMEQELPEHKGSESFATNPRKRGWLSQWYEDESKYAHPDAGRRSSHYVRPSTQRDFPATVEEYEMVKHHQKWHLNQPGTGTVLPWHSYNTTDSRSTVITWDKEATPPPSPASTEAEAEDSKSDSGRLSVHSALSARDRETTDTAGAPESVGGDGASPAMKKSKTEEHSRLRRTRAELGARRFAAFFIGILAGSAKEEVCSSSLAC
ncbi:LOW QUALITY PROTEIN: uncharacterized protein LOC126767374 [Bactrocera neohumeralis]|uniref:LOW QUALITY PROTEIN: uncharacterized protein LOC126767374 n=1 Tax=Bactrocera neohumeralis TaxID=98809 RepID=UPI0021658613|nr:LOW QUALITY PROTEIN: uncharacterized protein LOC126767374 [Bactrocera neohumeralis]